MLDMGRHWKFETGRFGLRSPARASIGPNLVVDLSDDLFSREWWRGAGTLALLCGAATLLVAKPFDEPLPVPGGIMNLRHAPAVDIVPKAAAMPIARAETGAEDELTSKLTGDDTLATLLIRMGATPLAASEAADAVGPIDAEHAQVKFRLGKAGAEGRDIERLSVRTGADSWVHVAASDGRLAVTRETLSNEPKPIRFDGVINDGLYFAMRDAGISSENAAAFLKILDEHIDLASDVAPGDRFTLILENENDAPGDLLFAALERQTDRNLQYMKWQVGGRSRWIDMGEAGEATQSRGRWPVNGAISSGYGMRRHPILRYTRMHSGLDFKAGYGTPIMASADGVVIGAGRNGGHGNQVRIRHEGGLASSYSHMSRFIVAPGMSVREGQVIGYVGSTGLSTGPHLHYEVKKNGRNVDPRSVSFATRPLLNKSELAKMQAAAEQLLSTSTEA